MFKLNGEGNISSCKPNKPIPNFFGARGLALSDHVIARRLKVGFPAPKGERSFIEPLRSKTLLYSLSTRGRNMCIPAGRKLAFLILWGLAPKPPGLAALVVFLQSVVSLNRAITISVYF